METKENNKNKVDPYEEVIRKLMEYEEGCPPVTRQEYACCCGCGEENSEE